jgi:hypothetical protein
MRFKKIFKRKNIHPQKGDIRHLFLKRNRAAFPDALSFNVNANEIAAGKKPRKPDRVFTSPACKLKCDGVGIFKVVFVPTALDGLIGRL